MRYFFLAALLPCFAYGQGTSHQRRQVALQPEVQAQVLLSQGAYVYAAFGGVRYTDYTSASTDRTLGLDVRYAAAGYEAPLRGYKWSWGATVRVAGTQGVGPVVQPGLLLRHRSELGPLVLGQRLGAEYAFSKDFRLDPAYNIASSYSAVSPFLLRLRLDLFPAKYFQVVNGLMVRPRVSFEPALFLRLQRDENDPDKRTIDFTSLRADVAFRIEKAKLDIAPWFALQTQYLRTVIQTDPNGNPTSNGKLNSVLPTVGLELRYHLWQANDVLLPELSTQH
ncbi:hypothetical protein Q5H93_11840 [Hymenobacter sp. ASUV-10]|uniref:DUF2490 domain-containing protein n=1 Tax=Hymenobacter aranciens TaxID=3063996 RepID=A0ABT9BCJ7_9BACT|nr:hypothetical protein [Hymenobacter sp. ASUV-10]MDO7875424.1 hypothetical protein [Hymenobacter sp. ASUV-10]